MICKSEMMPLMLDACPSFQPIWQEFLDDWKDEDCETPLYIALADLARHLIDLLERVHTEELSATFKVVERWHCEGEHYVQEAATIGLLESLLNLNLHTGSTNPEQFRPMLGPESERWWDNLIRCW